MANQIDLEEALAILEIQRVLFTNFRATDAKDWDLFITTLADEVTIEFVGLQPPATATRQQLRVSPSPTTRMFRLRPKEPLQVVGGDDLEIANAAHVDQS